MKKSIADMIFITCALAAFGVVFLGLFCAMGNHRGDLPLTVEQSRQMKVEALHRAMVMINDGRE